MILSLLIFFETPLSFFFFWKLLFTFFFTYVNFQLFNQFTFNFVSFLLWSIQIWYRLYTTRQMISFIVRMWLVEHRWIFTVASLLSTVIIFVFNPLTYRWSIINTLNCIARHFVYLYKPYSYSFSCIAQIRVHLISMFHISLTFDLIQANYMISRII